MGRMKDFAIESELMKSSYYSEDLYAETQWWEVHEEDEAVCIGEILAADALEHFDLIDKQAVNDPRGCNKS